LGVGDLLLVSARLRSLEFALELGDRSGELPGEAVGSCDLLWVGALPVLLVKLAHGGFDSAKAVLDGLDLVARNLADLLPAALDRGEGLLGLRTIGRLGERLSLGEQFELRREIRFEFDAVGGVDLRLSPGRACRPRP
jgi:hypothetical protein